MNRRTLSDLSDRARDLVAHFGLATVEAVDEHWTSPAYDPVAMLRELSTNKATIEEVEAFVGLRSDRTLQTIMLERQMENYDEMFAAKEEQLRKKESEMRSLRTLVRNRKQGVV